METVVTWFGSGFAFAFGMLCGAALFGLVIGRSKKEGIKAAELLEERNEIGREQLALLNRIASAVEGMERGF